ncbi:MAG: amidohydrolase [Alphaproteobacteria bacterium]|nr:MAG: amidohydrolase [Alphaproteobacteria bacterium]
MTQITVFPAKKIITMNPAQPEATAVAVRDGRILEVGTLESLRPWLEAFPHKIDDRFKDKFLMPGFIDPHLHPSMAAVLLPMRFVTAMEWRLPWEIVAPVTTPEAFLKRVRDIDAEMESPEAPLFIWGYHQLWHGKMRRAALDDISKTRPIVIWHRSFHELYMNSACLKWAGIDEASAGGHHQVDIENGHFFENGLRLAMAKLNSYLLSPAHYHEGLKRLARVAHFGGHTTLGDMAVGIFNFEMEWQTTKTFLDTDETPFRVQMIPASNILFGEKGSNEAALDFIKTLPERNTNRLRFYDHVKLFTDGAFFSQLMQLKAPGYIDGHHGEWLMPPEHFEAAARTYWNAGYKIHVHCTGDLGVDLALDTLAKLQEEKPRFGHRFTIEHFGLSTPEQVRRMKELGALASVNIYYFHELSGTYAREGLGFERASQMARVGSLLREGVPFAFHSDFTMAPALPLNSASVAATRINAEGTLMGEDERVPVHDALKAITSEAAWILGLEDEIGSIRAGKKADFTVLEEDPYQVAPESLNDIPIWGTIFEGTPHEIVR